MWSSISQRWYAFIPAAFFLPLIFLCLRTYVDLSLFLLTERAGSVPIPPKGVGSRLSFVFIFRCLFIVNIYISQARAACFALHVINI